METGQWGFGSYASGVSEREVPAFQTPKDGSLSYSYTTDNYYPQYISQGNNPDLLFYWERSVSGNSFQGHIYYKKCISIFYGKLISLLLALTEKGLL